VDGLTPERGGRPRQIDRAISAQEWEGFSVAAQLNGQDEGRARQPAPGPALANRRGSGASPTRPGYLLLPEAESYDSFMLLAHAFRHWRSHAASEQTMRYAARLHLCTCSHMWVSCLLHAVFACLLTQEHVGGIAEHIWW